MLDKLTQWRNPFTALFACVVAAVMEGASGGVLWYVDNSLHQIAGFLLLHLTACLILASAFTGLLPLSLRHSGRRTADLIFCLSFFIPWFGMLGIIGALLPVLWWPKPHTDDSNHSGWSYLSIPPLPDHSPSPRKLGPMHYGVASIGGVLQGTSDLGQREQSVLATLRLRDHEAIPLLRQALQDTDDDVRLLAYALLDRKEEAITARIRMHQRQLGTAGPAQWFSHHSAIAYDCWELIHVGLVQGDVMNYLLQTARAHVKKALELQPQSAGLQFLLGKLLVRTGELELASEAFRQAELLGIDSQIVNSQLAEIDFSREHLASADGRAGRIQPPVVSKLLHGAITN